MHFVIRFLLKLKTKLSLLIARCNVSSKDKIKCLLLFFSIVKTLKSLSIICPALDKKIAFKYY